MRYKLELGDRATSFEARDTSYELEDTSYELRGTRHKLCKCSLDIKSCLSELMTERYDTWAVGMTVRRRLYHKKLHFIIIEYFSTSATWDHLPVKVSYRTKVSPPQLGYYINWAESVIYRSQ
jgi:hypothetical protein